MAIEHSEPTPVLKDEERDTIDIPDIALQPEGRREGVAGRSRFAAIVMAHKLLAIAALAFLMRAVWVMLSDNSSMGSWSDEGGGIALNMLEGRGYVYNYGPNPSYRSFRVPGLPLVLYGLWSVFGYSLLAAKLFLAAVSSVNVLLAAGLGRRLWGERAGLIAALFTAFYPNFIYWAGTLGPETLAMTFLLLTTLLVLQERFAAGGVAAGLLILTRAVFLPYAGLLAGWVFLRRKDAVGARQAMTFLSLVALLLAPWAYRNWLIHGQLLLLSTEGGLVFFECNNARALAEGGDWTQYYFHYAPEFVEKAQQMGEVEFDRFLYLRGLEGVRDNPALFTRAFFLRIYQLWRPFPRSGYSTTQTVLFLIAWLPVFLIALWQLVSIRAWRRADQWPILLALLWVTVAGGIFYSVVRYRAPVEPFVVVYAAGGIDRMLGRSGKSRAAAGSRGYLA